MQQEFKIVNIESVSLEQLKAATDLLIGRDYYTANELKKLLSDKDSKAASFALLNGNGDFMGFRISLAYPHYQEFVDAKKYSPDLWECDLKNVAYFKSLFLLEEVRGQGWGTKLSKTSMGVFKKLGYKKIFAHSWKESPSKSFYYLKNLGFQVIKEHPNFWSDIDYECTRCKTPPCDCTALEMLGPING